MLNFQFRPLTNGSPIIVSDLPDPIKKEIDVWVKECKKIKNHPLSQLKSHENAAYELNSNKEFNSYQCGIPPQLIENSFWLPYTLRICSNIFGGNHRNYFIRKWDGHFDGYDIWTNFSYKGNSNPMHDHAGSISGVIYYQNHKHPTVFPDYNTEYDGKNGTMIIFPSNIRHYVEEQTSRRERITIAFNINIRLLGNDSKSDSL